MGNKYSRRIKIIKSLSTQIYLLDEKAFAKHPNWETDERDVDYLFWLAKKILNSGLYHSIENVSIGGIAGSQVITQGTIKNRGSRNINYNNVLEKAVQKLYERQKQKIPDNEEQKRIIKLHIKEPDNPGYKRQFETLKDRLLNLNRDLIRSRLKDKLDNYLMTKPGH